jgi:GNAT superfamily N-acetyltransferase
VTEIVLSYVSDEADLNVCDELLREYGSWSSERLASNCGIDLTDDQLESAHAMFRAEFPKLRGPKGRLCLAMVNGNAAGVGALKPVSSDICELKRMFVRPGYRRNGIGRLILERLIDDARQIGFRQMRLETMTYMPEAHSLYRAKGFAETEPFEAEGAGFGLVACELFMVLSL